MSLIYCKNINEIKQITKHTLTVAMNKYASDELPSGKSRNFLLECFQKYENISQLIDADETKDIEERPIFDNKCEYETKLNWLWNIYTEIQVTNDTDVNILLTYENMFYLPKIIPIFFRLIEKLPLWSGIMIYHFNSESILATSANIENLFGLLKNNVFKDNKLPMRVDLFLQKHIYSLNGSTKLAIHRQPNITSEHSFMADSKLKMKPVVMLNRLKIDKNESSIIYQSDLEITLNHQNISDVSLLSNSEEQMYDPKEEWKGKITEIMPKSRCTRRNPDSILNPTTIHMNFVDSFKQLGILKNFYVNKKEKNPTYTYNTCVPDTIIQILTACYIDKKSFQQQFDYSLTENKKDHTFQMLHNLVTSFAKHGATNNTYKLRTSLLSALYESEIINNMTQINCDTAVSTFLENSIKNSFPSLTITEKCTCVIQKQNFSMFPINYNVLKELGITCLQHAIHATVHTNFNKRATEICKDCNEAKWKCYEVSSLLFIDVQLANEDFTWISNSISINLFPKIIKILRKNYSLKGIVEFIPSQTISGINHYVANCQRPNNNWYRYDNTTSKVTKSNFTCVPHTLIYVET